MIGTDSYHIVIDYSCIEEEHNFDYRYSSIEITEIDIVDIEHKKTMAEAIEPIKAKLLGKGIIRLYREFEDEEEEQDSGQSDIESLRIPSKRHSNPGDDTMVAILAVPTYFTATDLLGFIGENYMNHISHVRILKSDKPNRFLVLIKFRDIIKAAEFQYHYNGKPFNSMEPEACHVVYVKSIQMNHPPLKQEQQQQQQNDTADSLIPFLLQDPFTSPPDSSNNSPVQTSIDKFVSLDSGGLVRVSLVELPTCPVCLERMDSTITGLLTIPCQHTFHCQCLSKWKDDTCPICRYSHSLSNEKVRRSMTRLQHLNLPRRTSQDNSNQLLNHSSSTATTPPNTLLQESTSETEVCNDCPEISNLWICLVCGNVGCSRYAPQQHSLKHFVNTGHCFAMEISTSRVWDYAGDNYVHRLVTNESDGKLVELPDKNSVVGATGKSNNNNNNSSTIDKIDEVGFEYSQLLISQLASQREYYESLLAAKDSPTKLRRGSSMLPAANLETVTELHMKIEDLSLKLTDLTTNLIPSLKEKIQIKDEKLNSVMRELNIANSLNDALSKKIEYIQKDSEKWNKKIEELNDQNKRLQEEVSDLMFFLDSQEKFKNESQDVRDGTIVIQQSSKTSSSSSKKSKKKKK